MGLFNNNYLIINALNNKFVNISFCSLIFTELIETVFLFNVILVIIIFSCMMEVKDLR